MAPSASKYCPAERVGDSRQVVGISTICFDRWSEERKMRRKVPLRGTPPYKTVPFQIFYALCASYTLRKLTTLDIQKFYNSTRESGRIQLYEGMARSGLSNKTVRSLHAMFRQCLDQAVMERLIPYNPAANCKLPPKEKKEMQIIPPASGEASCWRSSGRT